MSFGQSLVASYTGSSTAAAPSGSLSPSLRPSRARSVGSWSGCALEDLAIELHGARHVVEVLLVELGDPVLEADGLVRIARHLALARQHGEQLAPVLGLLVEDVEAREGLHVVGIELEDLRVRVDGARHVAELALVDRADLVVDGLLLLDVGDEVGLLRVDRRAGPASATGRGSGE